MPITVFPTSSASTDRTTFGALRADLARSINPDDPAVLAMAGDAVVTALKVFSRYNWPWDLIYQDISVTSGTDTYALAQKFKLPMAGYLLDSSSRLDKRLRWIPYGSFLESYSANQDGQPVLYTVPNAFESGQVLLYPRPSQSYTFRLHYYRMTAFRFRTDETPLEIPDYADEPLRAWAWYELLKKLGGSANIARLPSARADAMAGRAELVALVNSRGDMLGPV